MTRVGLPIGRSGWPTRLILSVCVLVCFASVAKPATQSQTQNATAFASHASVPFALGDFDGDNQLDIATVRDGQFGALETRYWIDFYLSGGSKQFIAVTAPVGGVHIASRDVNGDNFLDLIVTSEVEHRPIAVLLNDGRGHFTLHDPRSFAAAICEAQSSWESPFARLGDIAAALISRTSFAGSGAAQELFGSALHCASVVDSSSRQDAGSLLRSILGRAPPILQA